MNQTSRSTDSRMHQWAVPIGVGGSLLMYAGDILLYGTPSNTDITLDGITRIMAALPTWRVMLGGLVGPLASLLYCIGFHGICREVRQEHDRPGLILFLLFSLAILYGGAYHSHYPYLTLADAPHATAYLSRMTLGAGIPMAAASLLFLFLVLTGRTRYRKRIALVSPLPLILLGPPLASLPAPWLTFIAGGWNNLLFTVFFTACALPALKRN